ncbi:hypothetical protein QR680_013750 [Steinernema hermaphroditum]|uniref:Fatty-acid and retinol-binding protein 1 n=1 Tax=Steinernema hermaphroditum TaxID=289476 RepID=A0AA39I7Y4_9BILA|nr:hypothetical protein QR680_013750 [Steinernema hermaphroditum]
MNLRSFGLLLIVAVPAILAENYEGHMLICGFVPSDYYEFMSGLSEGEVDTLQNVKAANFFVDNATELIEKIRDESPELADKIEKFHDEIYEKLDQLSEGAKDFMAEMMGTLAAMHDMKPNATECLKKCMKATFGYIKKAEKMPEDEMAEIETAFPNVKQYWEDPKVKKFLEKNLNKDPKAVVDKLVDSETPVKHR